ncbi:MAG: adenosylmethionine--8-amino-7-oxononanoate transaminase [Deltaproteobacteria bacterium]|nr:adenosylmethionine--8-amino-7-oxononanoate transaminase [Deltaproteobacteria bacterium]
MTSDKKRLQQLDRKHIWHPFTQMKEWEEEEPLVIASGEGSYLIDVDGNRYLDGVSSLWVTVHGHRKGKLDEAVKSQLHKIAHSTLLGLSNIPAVELAEKLLQISPEGLSRVFYSDSGSTAVEIALKMAFQYRQLKGQKSKTRFIALKEAYHGDTIGSVSVGGMELFHDIFRPLLFDAHRVMTPFCYRCEKGLSYPSCKIACLGDVEKLMKKEHENVAAMLVEPLVQGAAGMIVHPEGYLKGLRELCDRFDIHLILDEVATGFGRTGRMFASVHEEVRPDIMAVAKGITGGYLPLAATVTTEEIYNAFKGEYGELKTFFHGHTYTGNPLACAAAIANIDLFEQEETIKNMQDKVSYLAAGLKRFHSLHHVGDVRQKGFMVGIELVEDKESKKPYPFEMKMGHRVIMEARKSGVIIRPLGNVVVLMPPLSITADEIDKLLNVVYMSIERATAE